MAVQKFLEELSVQQLVGKYNFIIPEIQREYVWGNNDYFILDKFFNDVKEVINESKTNKEDKTQIELWEKMLERADDKDKESIKSLIDRYISKKDLNIGFLYSYRPDYYVFNDRSEDVYLIDGQQRFTTLFLMLLYFSLRETVNYSDFKTLFRFDKEIEFMAFDYRVRTLTHNFLQELVDRCKTIEDLVEIEKKSWFLSDFANDVTVVAMIKAIKKLHEHFKDDKTDYYLFIKKQIKFWHFKTEETSQGEELYITMNSRGQQLAENETSRAILFENDKVKNQQIVWGAKWEEWQDFFWKNREKGGNADNGLNQFLRWVNLIECFSNEIFKTKEEAENKYKSLTSDNQIAGPVTLFEIEPYFKAFEELKFEYDNNIFNTKYFKQNFNLAWLKGEINQIELIKLLPALMFIKQKKPKHQLNRFIRFFSNITKDSDISKNPDTYIIESIELCKKVLKNNFVDVSDLIAFSKEFPKILTSEEEYKLSSYKNINNVTKRKEYEESFWEAEDFLNNNGKIGHLIQMTIYDGDINNFSFNKVFNYQCILSFNINKFKQIYLYYIELINQVTEVWGDLIDTEMYIQAGDRIYENANWHLNNAFLKMVLYRYKASTESLESFSISNEKKFLLSYKDKEEVENEMNPKRQLYIYYILHKRLLNRWKWDKWNFGKYDGSNYPSVKSIFNHKFVYQFYDSQWRYNVGYEPGTGIWLQDHLDKKRDYISELLTWAKK